MLGQLRGESSMSSSPSSSSSSSESNHLRSTVQYDKERIIPIEVLLVDQDAAKELQCGICLQLLDKPRQCKNGHLFCLGCIMQSLEKSSDCPHCRCTIIAEELARSLFVEKHIRNLKVYCKYHFTFSDDKGFYVDEDGCPYTSTVEELQKHENGCGYACVSCKYSPSCGKLRKAHLGEHEKVCPYRPEMCTHCKADVQFISLEDHFIVCGMVPVQCPRCSVVVKRSELDKHLKELCLEEETLCPFHDNGCTFKVLRKELKEHLCEEHIDHMVMMKKGFDEQLLQMKQEYEKMFRSFDERIRQLEKDKTETKIEWKVKNYSQLRKKSYVQSDKFTIAGFTWFIGFYTDGDNSESKGFISIYLFLDVGHLPKGKSINLEYWLKFVNHKDPAESVKKEFKTSFPIKGGQGWGDRKALKNHLLDQNGFLKDDTLLVEAEIMVKKTTWSV